MIHLTVAQPMGIDSVFFSFIQRLALQNGHGCVDPPAQQLDEPDPGAWIEGMKSSHQHHFVIGYRYPPSYWMRLVESASSVCLLADPDGISRQVESLQGSVVPDQHAGQSNPVRTDWQEGIGMIRTALDATIALAECMVSAGHVPTQIIPHATAFFQHSSAAFQRLESFYLQSGVSIETSCWRNFSEEAQPLIRQLSPPVDSVRRELHRLLLLKDATPSRLEALAILFGHGD